MKSTIIGLPELRAGRKIKSDESPRFPASFSIFLDTLIVAKKKPELNDHPSGTILSYWSPHLTSSKRMKKEPQNDLKNSPRVCMIDFLKSFALKATHQL